MALREAFSPEQSAEINRLLDALPVATRLASGLLRETSPRDPLYLAADAEVAKILTRISELMNRRHIDANDGDETKATR